VQVVTSADRPDLESEARDALRGRWPEFIFHGEAAPKYLARVAEYFRYFDVLLLDDGRVAAGGWGVAFAWNGIVTDLPDGYDGALARSVDDHEAGRAPTALSFMAAAVAPAFDKQGMATQVLEALIERARERGIAHAVAPLRPTLKHRYPLQTMAEYATWTREDGLSIDPWVRTHQRMGATILGPADRSMVIIGTVSEWESWTGMVFPASGQYVVPEALNTVHVDRDADLVTYVEENLWVQHH
jgi:GNAT superfamily N-acetyltransferase